MLDIFTRRAPAVAEKALSAADTAISMWFAPPTIAGVAVTDAEVISSVAGCCVSLIADGVASLELGVSRVDGAPLSPSMRRMAAALRRRPCDYLSPFEWRRLLMTRLLFEGEAALVVVWDSAYRPAALIPIPRPTRMVSTEGAIFWNVGPALSDPVVGPRLRAAGYARPAIADHDMVIIRAIPALSDNGLRGLAPVVAATRAVALAAAEARHAEGLFGSGARPGGVLSAKGKLSAEAIARLRTSWDNAHGGVVNSGKTAVLEDGLEWTPISMTSIDAQTLESRRFQVEEIARFFRVPLSKLGLTGAMPKASAEAEARSWLDDCLRPWLENIESSLESKLLYDDANHAIEFDCDGLLRADFASRMEG